MLFNSFHFPVFFALFMLGYFSLPHRGRPWLLFFSSCYFYMAFLPKYIVILFLLILVDYGAGIWIENASGKRRKLILILSLAANLIALGLFKYYDFFSENLTWGLRHLGLHVSLGSLSWLLPLGLSFHTFQSMSYTIEVYRGRVPAVVSSITRFTCYFGHNSLPALSKDRNIFCRNFMPGVLF